MLTDDEVDKKIMQLELTVGLLREENGILREQVQTLVINDQRQQAEINRVIINDELITKTLGQMLVVLQEISAGKGKK